MDKGVTVTQSAVYADEKGTSSKNVVARPDLAERRLRQGSAWVVLYLLLQAELGLAWDRNWHDLVGRDTFWIPPHIMIYSGLGCAGLMALGVVLVEMVRYFRRAPGVDDSSTVSVFWLFHAPLGFVMLGFGALTDLLAAPLDNYWHQLYGIDVTLWSPFHIMGTIGGVLAGLGLVYAFASEAAIERQGVYPVRRFLGLNGPEWGALVLFTGFIELTLPALTAFVPISLGPWQLQTYPLPLVAVGGLSLIGAIQLTRKPGAATITAILLWLVALITQAFVPWALNYAVPRLGLTFRYAGREPAFNLTLFLLPLIFLLCAFLIDGFAYWQCRHKQSTRDALRGASLLGALMALPIVVLVPYLVQLVIHVASPALVPPDVIKVLRLSWSDLLFTLPLAALLGIVIARLVSGIGDIWYWNRR